MRLVQGLDGPSPEKQMSDGATSEHHIHFSKLGLLATAHLAYQRPA